MRFWPHNGLTFDRVKPIVIAALVLALFGGAIYFMNRPTPDADRPGREGAAGPAATGPAADPTAEPARPSPEAARAAPARKTPRKAEPVASSPAASARPTTATLMVETDVPGASVFVNRQYVGTTPLRLDRLEPGSKQLKLTADGYDGIERTVDLVAGENPLTLRFREVRLDKRIAVSHKHGMGGCAGTLVATVDGLAYESANKNDAFTLSYAEVDHFTVDYLEKNLQVKEKGGKTWNFTDKNAANADALFVFHRDVEAARKKLADGYAPVR